MPAEKKDKEPPSRGARIELSLLSAPLGAAGGACVWAAIGVLSGRSFADSLLGGAASRH